MTDSCAHEIDYVDLWNQAHDVFINQWPVKRCKHCGDTLHAESIFNKNGEEDYDWHLMFTYEGRTLNLSKWCRELKIPYETTQKRIRRGWTFEESIKYPEKTK